MSSSRVRSPAARKPMEASTPTVTPVVVVPALVAAPTPVKTFLQVWWSLIFAACVIGMSCVVDPKQTWSWPPLLELTGSQARSVFQSPWHWACCGPCLVGVVWLKYFFKKHNLVAYERGMMVWWLTNLCIFHVYCDVLSGYFQVMPGLTQLYASMTSAHNDPQWADSRGHLDTTYFLELVIEAPFALLMLILYARRHPGRYVMEIFAVAVQMAGTVVYYMPALMRRKETPNWLGACDRAFGFVWMVVPFLVLWGHFNAASPGQVKKD